MPWNGNFSKDDRAMFSLFLFLFFFFSSVLLSCLVIPCLSILVSLFSFLIVCLFSSLGKSTFTHSDLHELCATSINHNLMRAHLSMYTYILCLLSLFVCISYLYEYEYWTRKETFIVEILRVVRRTFSRRTISPLSRKITSGGMFAV